MENEWKYKSYVEELSKQKTVADIDSVAFKHFPKIAKKTKRNTEASRFHKTILHIFRIRGKTEVILWALRKLYPLYEQAYPLPKTLKQNLSSVRSVLKANQSAEAYRKSKHSDTFNLSLEARDKITHAYKRQVLKKNSDKIQIDEKKIYEKIQELIQSDNVYDRALSLMLCLGTRPIELFSKNTFTKIKGRDSWIKVGNLAKKREGQKSFTERPVLFFSVKFILKEVGKFRAHFEGKIVINSNGRLASDKNASLNQRALIHFPWISKIYQKSSALRKVYASLAYKNFADKSKQNFNTFISRILGHDDLDLSTSFSYSYLNVCDPNKNSNTQLNSEMNELREQVKYLMKINSAVPTPPVSPTSPTAKNSDKLEKIYKSNPGITNRKMRELSGFGSKRVNTFLKSKKV